MSKEKLYLQTMTAILTAVCIQKKIYALLFPKCCIYLISYFLLKKYCWCSAHLNYTYRCQTRFSTTQTTIKLKTGVPLSARVIFLWKYFSLPLSAESLSKSEFASSLFHFTIAIPHSSSFIAKNTMWSEIWIQSINMLLKQMLCVVWFTWGIFNEQVRVWIISAAGGKYIHDHWNIKSMFAPTRRVKNRYIARSDFKLTFVLEFFVQ